MEPQVALYWDFENIHASVYCKKYSKEKYKQDRFAKQENVVDIGAIMGYAESLGNVCINKAYCHWLGLQSYKEDLLNYAVDLVQLFPRGHNAKNGADIRLAIDLMEDLARHPHLSTFVIIGGDSDFIAVAQKVKEKGRSIHAIGVEKDTNKFWRKACHEFKRYSDLVQEPASVKVETNGHAGGDLEEAKGLLREAVRRICQENGESFARKASLKQTMQRIDSTFDEANYNFESFTKLLEGCPDVVGISRGDSDHHIFLVEDFGKGADLPVDTSESSDYRAILKRHSIRLVPRSLFEEAIEESFHLFSQEGALSELNEFKVQLTRRLADRGTAFAEADVSKFKTLLHKSYCFESDEENHVVRLPAQVDSAELLRRRILKMLVSRIVASVSEINFRELSELLLEDDSHCATLEALAAECREEEQAAALCEKPDT